MTPAPFKVQSETLDGVHVVSIQGELDLNTAPELDRELEAVLEDEESRLLIDLSDCEFLDSTGIALIVKGWQRLNKVTNGQERGHFAICSVNDQVRRLLDITGLETSIPVHGGREEALAELRD